MSVQGALTIVGQAVGFYFGGPWGAAVGGAIGSLAGGAIEGPTKIEGTKLSDLRVGQSTYGAVIPIVYGNKNRISGNLIWTSGLKETAKTEEQGGKGGGGVETTTYSYSADVAIALCEGATGPIDIGMKKINRIWCNGKLLLDIGSSFSQGEIQLTQAISYYEAKIESLENAIENDPQSPNVPTYQAQLRQAQEDLLSAQEALEDFYEEWGVYESGGIDAWRLLQIIKETQGANVRSVSFYPGTYYQEPDPTIQAALGADNTPAYRGICYVVLADLQLADYGNSIPTIEIEIESSKSDKVKDIINDITIRSGLDISEYEISDNLDYQVDGMVIARQSSAVTAMSGMGIVSPFDITESGGIVRFVKRGNGPKSTINDYDLGARESGQDPEELINFTRLPEYDLPKSASLTYRSELRDYQENTQITTRDKGNVQNQINSEIAMTIDDGKARSTVDRLLWESWIGRVTATFKVNDKYSFLRPGDIVTINVANVMTPFRINQFSRGLNGVIECHAIMEDPFIYDGYENGASAEVPPNEVVFTGDTFIYVFNAPIIFPSESATGFNWAIDAEEKGWRGGQIRRSTNGIDFNMMSSEIVRNRTGNVSGILGSANAEYWDNVNTIDITMTYANHQLESRPDEDILNGYNSCWIGHPDGSVGEVIQFANATLINGNPKVYRLSRLLRGRRGTEYAINSHQSGEIFVAFKSDNSHVADFGEADINKLRYYDGVSTYQTTFDGTEPQEFVNVGEKAKPRSPVLAKSTRDQNGNLYVSWTRRVRGLATTLGYGEVALDEQSERYQIDIYLGSNVVRTINTNESSFEYTATQQNDDGITPFTYVTLKIYQISGIVGRGHAGEFTL